MNKYFLFFFFLLTSLIYSASNYYHNFNYGSECTYNPLSAIICGGYDIFQTGTMANNPLELNYKKDFNNIWDNYTHPINAINKHGWSKFIKQEVFPYDFNMDNSNYVPNYALHLIGGGVEYKTLCEWYEQNNITYPKSFAVATCASYHFLNEVVENGGYVGNYVDPIADLWIFDPLGIILFSSNKVSDFFANTLNARDWSGLPMYDLKNNRLENASQNFSLKYYLPNSKNIYSIAFLGMNNSIGVGFKSKNELAYSLTAGADIREIIVNKKEGSDTDITKDASITWNTCFFIDKNNSLIASLIFSGHRIYKTKMNIYPNDLVSYKKFRPGIFFAIDGENKILLGITHKYIPLGLSVRQK